MKNISDIPTTMNIENYILLADDDEDDRFLMEEFLSKNGYKCTTLTSGVSTVRFLKTLYTGSYPSLIILDYTMPLLNGEEVLMFVKKEEYLKNIPVIIYSSEMNEILKSRLKALGAYNCFPKAFHAVEFNEIKNTIDTLLIPGPIYSVNHDA